MIARRPHRPALRHPAIRLGPLPLPLFTSSSLDRATTRRQAAAAAHLHARPPPRPSVPHPPKLAPYRSPLLRPPANFILVASPSCATPPTAGPRARTSTRARLDGARERADAANQQPSRWWRRAPQAISHPARPLLNSIPRDLVRVNSLISKLSGRLWGRWRISVIRPAFGQRTLPPVLCLTEPIRRPSFACQVHRKRSPSALTTSCEPSPSCVCEPCRSFAPPTDCERASTNWLRTSVRHESLRTTLRKLSPSVDNLARSLSFGSHSTTDFTQFEVTRNTLMSC